VTTELNAVNFFVDARELSIFQRADKTLCMKVIVRRVTG
jgi:hypothetical protein